MIFDDFTYLQPMEKTKCRNISGLDEVGEEEAGWFQNGGPSLEHEGQGKEIIRQLLHLSE